MSSISFWNGASGMRAYQSKLDVVAHNIANVNTNGYKTQRAAFDDLIRTQMNTNVEGNNLVGHGVKQQYIDNLMTQGSLQETGFDLDFAIAGEGFFGVDANGVREYTRNGAFHISVAGNQATLVTNDGAFVLDRNGQRIQLPYTNGQLDTTGLAQRLGVWNFANPYGLVSEDNARFSQSDNSGAPTLTAQAGAGAQRTEVKQYYLELSGVELSKQMVEVIEAQRAFQMNSRVVQTADQIADELNNLR